MEIMNKNNDCMTSRVEVESIIKKLSLKYQINLRNTNPIVKGNRNYYLVKTSKKNREIWKDRQINAQKLVNLDKHSNGSIHIFDDMYMLSLRNYSQYQTHHKCRCKSCCNPEHIFDGFIDEYLHRQLDVASDLIIAGKTNHPLVKKLLEEYPFLSS